MPQELGLHDGCRTFRLAETTGNMKKKRTQEEFPITVKKGHASVKVYKVKNRNLINYTVSYVDGNEGRKRRTFADLEEARAEAANIAESLNKGDLEVLKLTGGDKQIYRKACEALAPTRVPLLSVAHEFARAYDILGGAHIVEAARYFKRHVDVDLPQVTVAAAVEKFRQAKEAEGMSAMYLKDIRTLLGDFADDFQCPLASIQPEDLREYLAVKKIGLVSKENRRRMLVVLFNFAKAQGWLRKSEETAADALGTYKIKQREVEIYAPAEISRLLNVAEPDFLPYLALIAFGGVRREELHKGMSWDAINFDRQTITVPAAIAKTGRKRKIVMNDNLVEWLKPYRFKHGPIFNKDPRKRIAKVVKASKVKWERNALRHSFGSYRMEQTKNEGQVALEMGNSPKVVKDYYFEIVDEREAREYWDIKPLSRHERKIVALA
jgi:integrase